MQFLIIPSLGSLYFCIVASPRINSLIYPCAHMATLYDLEQENSFSLLRMVHKYTLRQQVAWLAHSEVLKTWLQIKFSIYIIIITWMDFASFACNFQSFSFVSVGIIPLNLFTSYNSLGVQVSQHNRWHVKGDVTLCNESSEHKPTFSWLSDGQLSFRHMPRNQLLSTFKLEVSLMATSPI